MTSVALPTNPGPGIRGQVFGGRFATDRRAQELVEGVDKSKQGSKYLLITSLGALGVVFGDIGTSPLYAFRESFHAAEGLIVNEESVLGVLSLMLWSLILVVSVRYFVFVNAATPTKSFALPPEKMIGVGVQVEM